MTSKERYHRFCRESYVPVYSQPWWMDAVCGPGGWDVWLYERGDEVLAAMPYYMEDRDGRRYITKAPLTQNNGIVFKERPGAKACTQAEFEERVIREACGFIRGLGVDVYEQQYQPSFRNWLPFFWEGYTATTRYTYVIEAAGLDEVWGNLSSNYRKNIKKGRRNTHSLEWDVDMGEFYQEHEKVFRKQGLSCPFPKSLWLNLYERCRELDRGVSGCIRNGAGQIQSLIFLIWDEESVYLLLGGNMPEFQREATYTYLIWESIKFALLRGLRFDFEGSVIERISKSYREFGGEPRPYFRIRKVFSPEVMREEAERAVQELQKEVEGAPS